MKRLPIVTEKATADALRDSTANRDYERIYDGEPLGQHTSYWAALFQNNVPRNQTRIVFNTCYNAFRNVDDSLRLSNSSLITVTENVFGEHTGRRPGMLGTTEGFSFRSQVFARDQERMQRDNPYYIKLLERINRDV